MDEEYDETLYRKMKRGEITESQFGDLLERYGDKVYVTRVRAAVGSLKELNLADISIPLAEVRDYLAARYNARFQIHPRLFEETVGAVFSGLGYAVVVTAYSGDNGIDVIMRRSDDLIGVQVKRYRNADWKTSQCLFGSPGCLSGLVGAGPVNLGADNLGEPVLALKRAHLPRGERISSLQWPSGGL
jgi:hypothetical protein